MVFESFAGGLSFLLWTTFALALVFGAIANKTSFCTMGAVSDMVNMGDTGRFRAWVLAIAVAMIGVTVLEYFALVNVSDTFPPYRAGPLLLGEHLLGGFMFGIGMTLASGCGNKTLVRIGGGNLKSVVVFIVIGIVAYYMVSPFPGTDQTLFSVLFYDWLRPTAISLSGRQDLGALLGGNEHTALYRLIAGLVISLTLFFLVFRSAEFRASRDNILGGAVIGLAVLGFWFTSSNIQIDAFDDLYPLDRYYQQWDMLADSAEGKPAQGRPLNAQSFTFINPIGQSYGYAKQAFDSSLVTAGLVAVFGVILGSLLWSLRSRSFRFEWFVDRKDFFNHVIGGVLMGSGGTLALGCTIGQGITGLSTLALGSVITFVAIVFGSALTMKMQYYRMLYEAEASFSRALLTSLVDMKLLPESLRKLTTL